MNLFQLTSEWIEINHRIKDLKYWISKYPDVQSYKVDLQYAEKEERKLKDKIDKTKKIIEDIKQRQSDSGINTW